MNYAPPVYVQSHPGRLEKYKEGYAAGQNAARLNEDRNETLKNHLNIDWAMGFSHGYDFIAGGI